MAARTIWSAPFTAALFRRDLFERIKAAFNERFVDPGGRIEGDTQAGYAVALHFDLLPEKLRPPATEHLIELGHYRIAYISDRLQNPFNFTSSYDRYRGYRQALEAAGIPFNAYYHGEGEHGRYEARILAERILALPDRPTAIFAASDTQAEHRQHRAKGGDRRCRG